MARAAARERGRILSLVPVPTLTDSAICVAIPPTHRRTALVLPKGLSFEQWAEIGKSLQIACNSALWWAGDWWNFGSHAYGERAAQVPSGETYAYQTFRNAAWVCARVELSRRRDNVSFGIHAEVAAFTPEEQDALLDRAATEGWTVRDMRRAARMVKAGRTHREATALPTGKYRILLADPPWQYSNEMPGGTTTPADYYPLMSLEALCALPVREMAEENSVLFLWVPSPMLRESFAVIDAWDFSYKTSFVWDKIKHNMGHYNSVRHEFLLVCTRGSCTPDNRKLFDSVQTIERTKHSQKPEKFREIIDVLYPHGKRLELFARTKVDGWEVYGNECQPKDIPHAEAT